MLDKLRKAFPQINWQQKHNGHYAEVLGNIGDCVVRVIKQPPEGLYTASLRSSGAPRPCPQIPGQYVKKSPVAAVKRLQERVAAHLKLCVDFEQALPCPKDP